MATTTTGFFAQSADGVTIDSGSLICDGYAGRHRGLNGGEQRIKKKIKVELEFDDPAFVTVFTELARRKGITLGRLAALSLQNATHMHLEADTEFTRWARKQIGKQQEKFTYYQEEYLLT